MIAAELHRQNMPNCFLSPGLIEYCTMKENVQLCKLPNPNKKYAEHFKWPTLTELHNYLFNAVPKGAHNAIADVMICLRCYIYLHYEIDVAYDTDIKLVFRSLYSNYCV